jgi:SRSO17 transposase
VAFVSELVQGMRHVRQRENALVYVRGLIEQGGRKSLQPTLLRLGHSSARYESMQQFVADSPWEAQALMRAVAERVVPRLAPMAYVIDDTGFPKDGRHSPGVARQYSGTLGKVANCQIGISLHAVGHTGTLPVGWALYLPDEWARDPARRAQAKIPERVRFATRHELAGDLIQTARVWQIPAAPILADQAYGDSAAFRARLDEAGVPYVLAIGSRTGLWPATTTFTVPAPRALTGRRPSVARADRPPQSARALAAALGPEDFRQIAFSTGPAGTPRTGRFACVRVMASHPVLRERRPARQEWLIVEWPEGDEGPSDLWLSNLPAETPPEELAQLARLRWGIELDYRQLKGELGLDHYEGRSWAGWHHHCALVTCAHGFLTEERLCPPGRRAA